MMARKRRELYANEDDERRRGTKHEYGHRRKFTRGPHLTMYPLYVLVFFLLLGKQMVVLAQRPRPAPGKNATEQAQMDIPVMFDTGSPTLAPSDSEAPSLEPSSLPSFSNPLESFSRPLTRSPTVYPTISTIPTERPSHSPTELPSFVPSSVPSAVPTLTCHDKPSYRSPLNNFTCEDHANTDCTKWRFVGLNITQLEDLVESCPVTCEIPCGYFSALDMNVSFVISNVPGLIDDFETRPPLEVTTQEYLTAYILKSSPITEFDFTRVNLLRQDILNSSVVPPPPMNTSTRALHGGLRRRSRQLNESIFEAIEDYINLKVIINLQGFQIYPIRIVLTDLLLEAVDSPEYTYELRRSHSFYANATASSAAQEIQPTEVQEVPTPTVTEQRQVSPVTVAIIAVVVVSVVFSAAILYRKHRGARQRRRQRKRDTPADMELGQNSMDSNRANVFSFDLSPSNSVGRLLAVLSGESGHSTTSPSSSEGTSHNSQQAKTVVEEAHPYTGIIPPMLIIDNIEDPETDPNTSMRVIPDKAVVPTKHVEASGSFIEALNNRSEPGSSSTFSHLLQSVGSVGSGTHEAYGADMSLERRALDAILSGDGHVNDDSSVCSTPINSSDMTVDVQLRRALSSDQLDRTEQEDANEIFYQDTNRPWELEDVSSQTQELHVSVSYDQPPERSPHMDEGRPRSNSWNKQSFLGSPSAESFMTTLAPTTHTATVEHGPKGQLISSMDGQRSRSSSKGSNPSPPLRRNNDVNNTSRKRLHSSPSRRSSNKAHRSSGGNACAPSSECLYVYEASHRGYLGLSIEPCDKTGGTRIRAVKDYSPLFGLVEAGDRIVAVDEVETTYKTTAGVAELLRRRKGRNRKVRITVGRTMVFDTGGIPTLPIVAKNKRTRSKSIGGGTSSTSRILPTSAGPANNQYAFQDSSSSYITDLDSSYADQPTPSTYYAEAEEHPRSDDDVPDEPFHFLGAVASECEVDVSPTNVY